MTNVQNQESLYDLALLTLRHLQAMSAGENYCPRPKFPAWLYQSLALTFKGLLPPETCLASQAF